MGLRAGYEVVGEPQAALHTHTLLQLMVYMCLTMSDALSVMRTTVGIQIRENDLWE